LELRELRAEVRDRVAGLAHEIARGEGEVLKDLNCALRHRVMGREVRGLLVFGDTCIKRPCLHGEWGLALTSHKRGH
jgi:hypothetical protein